MAAERDARSGSAIQPPQPSSAAEGPRDGAPGGENSVISDHSGSDRHPCSRNTRAPNSSSQNSQEDLPRNPEQNYPRCRPGDDRTRHSR